LTNRALLHRVFKKVLGQARDVKVYLIENYISEIACILYRWHILDFQASSAGLEPESELSSLEFKLVKDPIVNLAVR
jgi:hypothetical protein